MGDGACMIKSRKIFRVVAFVIFVVFSAELAFFICFALPANQTKVHADLIAVFAGGGDRFKRGIALAKEGVAPNIVVSPANLKSLSTLKKRLADTHCRIIEESKAATTCENAYYVAKIIQEHDFKSVILVTSWWHMPRSYFLLYLALMGTSVEIIPYGVGRRSISIKTLFSWPYGLVPEFGRVWVSLGECVLKKVRLIGLGKRSFFK